MAIFTVHDEEELPEHHLLGRKVSTLQPLQCRKDKTLENELLRILVALLLR